MATVSEAHASARTRGLFCDGRPCFSIVTRHRKTGDRTAYWCETHHAWFDPFSVEECADLPKPVKKGRFNFGSLNW